MMNKLALNLPGGNTVPETGLQVGPNYGIQEASLGGVISGFLNLAFYIALVLVFIWFVWGAYEYIVSEGKKEALGSARERMKWALVGFIILVAAFLVGNWAPSIFPFIRTFYEKPVPVITPP